MSLGNGSAISNFFNCLIGVRQGENLSPALFAIFLNDLNQFLSTKYDGLNFVKNNLTNGDDIDFYMKLIVLLYADDTIILSESQNE